LRNWLIGAHLVEFEQRGRDRARYGAGLLKRLSGDLLRRGIEDASQQMLERMRMFYTLYPPQETHTAVGLPAPAKGCCRCDDTVSQHRIAALLCSCLTVWYTDT